jgi:hypothetical protein
MPHQPQLIPDQPNPEQAARDAERAEYLERLREKLKDPEFRQIEGFPIGEDEDILALSDPPYYTACPNPFLPEIIDRWGAERAQLRAELGLPDDSADNGDAQSASQPSNHPTIQPSNHPTYHREPFAADVSEGKNDPIYNAHSYHTKVPHKAVMRYVLHYTAPGDIVFDGFCGTGMTGVAAQLCGDKKTVESLGYRIKDDGSILDERSQPISHLGVRKAVLVDLCPAATLIAYNYNTPVDVATFEREAKRILREVEEECGWMYETTHTDGKSKGRINYIAWSDVFACPECLGEIVYWSSTAVDREAGSVGSVLHCPHCGVQVGRRDLERVWDSYFDSVLGETRRSPKQVPVIINYSVGRQRYEKEPDEFDCQLNQRISDVELAEWFPTYKMMLRDGKWGDEWRKGRHEYISHVHHLYAKRGLIVSAKMAAKVDEINDVRLRSYLRFWLQSLLLGYTRQNRYLKNAYSQVNRYLSGTIYIGALRSEVSPRYAFEGKLRRLVSAFAKLQMGQRSTVSTTSSTQLLLPDASIDYIFIDPPFGDNIQYSELNYLWESWLRVLTNPVSEAVISNIQRKGLVEYQALMEKCFTQFYAALKPGRWMTIEFHNSQNRVWNAIQEAVLRAGFMIADVRTLDKKQGTFKQVTAAGAVKQDLIISAYKPRTGFERRFLEQAGSEAGAWDFVRQHLEQLPVAVEHPSPSGRGAGGEGVLEVVAERQAYLLYDRMVAFHIQRGFSVPLGAAEFYAGLQQRFPERDGMYFLPAQAAEYDRRRLGVSKVEQLALFVSDEKSALQWLRRELDPATGAGPQTYQDLQPKFLRELHQARHEKLPELRHMLEENFLQDEADRWYVPDPERGEDLEKLRERSLLREFGEYVGGKGRLKVFRTEAVRAGFKRAWAERDYNTIVQVAGRLPESVLQEDPGLLMYYDNALMRAEQEPGQGRLLQTNAS